MVKLKRRHLLTALAAGAAALPSLGLLASAHGPVRAPAAGQSPLALAKNEHFWREVATYYDRT